MFQLLSFYCLVADVVHIIGYQPTYAKSMQLVEHFNRWSQMTSRTISRMLRHTGMCRPNVLSFSPKILGQGSHLSKENP